MSNNATEANNQLKSTWKLLLPSLRGTILVTGIYVFFLGFGYFQESVFETGNPPKDKFCYPIFLVTLLCLGNVLFSGFILYIEYITKKHPLDIQPPLIDDAGVKHKLKPILKGPNNKRSFLHTMILDIDWIHHREIILSSTTYVLSMICTNYALSHVNYPTQVLVKSAKSVPVILGGFLFFGKRYPLHDYITTLAVTVSLVIFNLSKPSNKSTHQELSAIGLLGVSLFCDSMTGPRQDKLLSQIKISSTHLMFLTNIAASILGLSIWGISEGLESIWFCLRYRKAVQQIFYFCLCASLGQLFIFGTLTEFGSLHLTLITTTRKFFTVFLSVLFFGHSVNILQWICVAFIFMALGIQSFCTKKLKSQVAMNKKNKTN